MDLFENWHDVRGIMPLHFISLICLFTKNALFSINLFNLTGDSVTEADVAV